MHPLILVVLIAIAAVLGTVVAQIVQPYACEYAAHCYTDESPRACAARVAEEHRRDEIEAAVARALQNLE